MSVDLVVDGAVAVITLNRPERKNAFTREQYDAFAAHLDVIAGRDDVRVAVVTGAGGSFSSGQDLKEMAELAANVSSGTTTPTDSSGTGTGFTILLDALQRFPKPLLAAVEGVAVGIGMTLLPYCDIVVVAESARMRVPFSELGVPPEAASSALLADLVGWQRAAEILLTSRWVSSDQAVEYGLALEKSADGRALEHALGIARTIAEKSAYSTTVIKQLMIAARGTRSQDARAREEKLFTELFRGGGYGG
jgi:enoyl-CoA hydratase/carnithine racemase